MVHFPQGLCERCQILSREKFPGKGFKYHQPDANPSQEGAYALIMCVRNKPEHVGYFIFHRLLINRFSGSTSEIDRVVHSTGAGQPPPIIKRQDDKNENDLAFDR
jgi:hypothetical protein